MMKMQHACIDDLCKYEYKKVVDSDFYSANEIMETVLMYHSVGPQINRAKRKSHP